MRVCEICKKPIDHERKQNICGVCLDENLHVFKVTITRDIAIILETIADNIDEIIAKYLGKETCRKRRKKTTNLSQN